MKNKTSLIFIIIILTMITTALVSAQSTNTYYVSETGNNADNGNETQPFATIQYAINEASAGDTIIVSNGTYDGFIVNNQLNITAELGAKPIIDANLGLGSKNRVVDIRDASGDADGTIISGLTIDADDISEYTVGISISADNVQIVGNTVLGNSLVTGIQTTSGYDGEGTDNVVIDENTIVDANVGISMQSGLDNATNNIIQNAVTEGLGIIGEGHNLKGNNITTLNDAPSIAVYGATKLVNGVLENEFKTATEILKDNVGAESVLFVDSDNIYARSVVNKNSELFFSSIQQAINEANAGDTIKISAGYYDESIKISKPIHLKGDSTGAVVLTSSESISCQGQTAVICITEDNISITNLTIDGDYNGDLKRGIKISNAQNLLLNNIVIQKIAGTGIDIFNGVNLNLSNLNISNNSAAGIMIKGQNISLQNISSAHNVWGGLAISDDGSYEGEIKGINISGNNNFEDDKPLYLESKKEIFNFGYTSDNQIILQEEDFSFFVGGNAKVDLKQVLISTDKESALNLAKNDLTHIQNLYVRSIKNNIFYVSENMNIQDAIDAANPGDTIEVSQGVYEEQIIIDKDNLTLKSEDNFKTIIKYEDTKLSDGFGVIGINANNVFISGFIFDGDGSDTRVLRVRVAENATITNNVLRNSLRGIQGNYVNFNYKSINISNNVFETDLGIAGTEDMVNLSVISNMFNTSVEGIGLGSGVENITVKDNFFMGEGEHVRIYNDALDSNFIETVLLTNNFLNAVIIKNEIITNLAIMSSIQNAINLANPGDIINVSSGIYNENIEFNTDNITLLGPNTGILGYDERENEAQINGKVVFNSNKCTLDGFLVNNTNTDAPIDLMNSDNTTILNNIVEDNQRGTVGIQNYGGSLSKGLIRIEGNYVINGPIGVYSEEKTIIKNNKVYGAEHESIWIVPKAETKIVIENNSVENSGKSDVKIVSKPASINEQDTNSDMLLSVFDENDVSSVYFQWMMVLEDTDLSKFNAFSNNKTVKDLVFIIGEEGEPNTRITLFNNTNISSEDAFDLNKLFADIDIASYDVDSRNANRLLKWGLSNVSLEFDFPVKIEFFVGYEFNNEKLDLFRSNDRSNWAALSTTCVVVDGYCTFNISHASYFAVVEQEEEEDTTTSSRGGTTYITRSVSSGSVPQTDETEETAENTSDAGDISADANETQEENESTESDEVERVVIENEITSNETSQNETKVSGITGLVTGNQPTVTAVSSGFVFVLALFLAAFIYYRSFTVAGLTKRSEKLHTRADYLNGASMYGEALDTRNKARKLQRKADMKRYRK